MFQILRGRSTTEEVLPRAKRHGRGGLGSFIKSFPRGHSESRITLHPLFDAEFYRVRYGIPHLGPERLYHHYTSIGRSVGHDPNQFFCIVWYCNQIRGVSRQDFDPLDHYLHRGAILGYDPSPFFSSWGYWLVNPDVKLAGQNPLAHYLKHGRHEGRTAPSPAALADCLGAAALLDGKAELERNAEIFTTRDTPPSPYKRRPRSAGHHRPEHNHKTTKDTHGLEHMASRTATRQEARRHNHAEKVMMLRSSFISIILLYIFRAHLTMCFHRVLLLGGYPLPVVGPIVLLTNHVSWWDAELFHWLAMSVFPGRRGFAPMNARHLSRCSILKRIGAYPVWRGGYRETSKFLRTTERLLADADILLIVASEGRYRDVRCRPLCVMPGMAFLAQKVPVATFIPVAIEYVFWRHRRPNLLVHFGLPIAGPTLIGATIPRINRRFNDGLTEAMSALAEAAQTRQPSLFEVMLGARADDDVAHRP